MLLERTSTACTVDIILLRNSESLAIAAVKLIPENREIMREIYLQIIGVLILLVSLAQPAQATTVYVKYRGPVELDGMNCHQRDSSLVWSTCYDAKNSYLVVNLKGTYYHYCRMPLIVVNQWRSAPSMGQYYLENIRGGAFDCRNGGIP